MWSAIRNGAVMGILVALQGLSAIPAAAAESIDQQNVGPNPAATSLFGVGDGTSDFAQTFTVGLSGRLTRIEVAAAQLDLNSLPLTVEIRSTTLGVPDALATAVLASASLLPSQVPITPAVLLNSLNLSSAGLNVTAGDVLAITFRSESLPGYFLPFTANLYGNGAVYGRLNNPGTGVFTLNPSVGDLYFRTFVDTAIPEPSSMTWLALMIGMLRRRNLQRA